VKINRRECRDSGRITAATPEGLAGMGTLPCFPQHHLGSTLRQAKRPKQPEAKNIRARVPDNFANNR